MLSLWEHFTHISTLPSSEIFGIIAFSLDNLH